MARPVIGLTTYAEQARFGLNDTLAAVLPLAYVHAVHESGGRAVLITPDAPDADVLDGLDGIMFTGGSDVDPALYGEAPHPTTKVNAIRDAAELLLLRAALAIDLPLLGVCRGIQLMAVAYGGRLYQHLPDVLGHEGHRPTGTGDKFGHHPVRLRPGSRAHAILGDELMVNSYHHQGVRDAGELDAVGWAPGAATSDPRSEATRTDGAARSRGPARAERAPTGTAPDDDLIEVVEDPARSFALGVQWHPEDTTDFRVFEALVEAARARRMALA